MTINGLGLLAVLLFTAWKGINFIVRAQAFPESRVQLCVELIYMIVMTYFLVTVSKLYLGLLIVNVLMYIAAGMIAEISPHPPGMKDDRGRIIEKYWQYAILDSVISFMAWLIMISGGSG